MQLHSTRNVGMQANSITHAEMLAYSTLCRMKLSQFDINAIKTLDRIALTDPIKLKNEIKKGANE